MSNQTCLLCGRERAEGLRLLGCLICFPCEQKLLRESLRPAVTRRARRTLYKLYPRAVRAQRAAPV